jgi:cytochrome c biogenesis protein CcdA
MLKPSGALAKGGSGLTLFHIGRMLGYASLGGVMGASLQGLGWLASHSAVFQPVWSLLHVAAAVLGLLLFFKAEQPAWLSEQAQVLWRCVSRSKGETVRSWGPQGLLVLGLVWTFLPCGLLYSALSVAALSSNAWDGGLVMLAFALGSTLVLASGPWAWRRLTASRGAAGVEERTPTTVSFWKPKLINTLQVQTWGLRLAGLSLAVVSTVSLWQALLNNQAPWCVTATV